MSQILEEKEKNIKEIDYKKDKKEKKKELSLEEEAIILSPILTKLYHQYEEKLISNYDLVAYFILLYLSVRKPNGWSNGRLDYPIVSNNNPIENSLKLHLNYDERSKESLEIIKKIIKESVLIENDNEGKINPSYLPKKQAINSENISVLNSLSAPSPSLGPSLKNKPAIAGNFNSIILSKTDEDWQEVVNLEYIAHKLCLLKNKKLPTKSDPTYKECLFNILDNFTLIDVFNNLMLTGIKGNTNHLINKNLVYWSLNERSYQLLTYIPTPYEVLKQQSYGLRVITLFYMKEKLSIKHISKLVYMLHIEDNEIDEEKKEDDDENNSNDVEIKEDNEEINTTNNSLTTSSVVNNDNNKKKKNILLHSRDCFYFLLHDCQHMEHYTQDIVLYYEQSGFFNSFYNVNNKKIKSFFLNKLNYNKKLYNEIEYVISDMNCHSPHMVKYTLAKIRIAADNKTENDQSLEDDWKLLLNEWRMFPKCTNCSNNQYCRFAIPSSYYNLDQSTESSSSLVCLSEKAYHSCLKLLDHNEPTVLEWAEVRSFFISYAWYNLENEYKK